MDVRWAGGMTDGWATDAWQLHEVNEWMASRMDRHGDWRMKLEGRNKGTARKGPSSMNDARTTARDR